MKDRGADQEAIAQAALVERSEIGIGGEKKMPVDGLELLRGRLEGPLEAAHGGQGEQFGPCGMGLVALARQLAVDGHEQGRLASSHVAVLDARPTLRAASD
jgi:hypothetical protein